jgi:alkaline phosphatase
MKLNELPRRRVIGLFLFFLLVPEIFADVWNYPPANPGSDVKDISFYEAPADEGLLKNITAGRPHNIILLIGDGMGFSHIALARHQTVGPARRLYMERLPVSGLVRTYSANRLITDSAAAATAMACGIKTDNGKIGVSPDATAYDTILECLRRKGWRTGLVATSTMSHATPAGFAAHAKKRSSEADIAADMLDNHVDILFGGGRKYWLSKPEGVREDGRNLIEEAANQGYQVIYSRDQLAALKPGPVLGLFAEEGMTTFEPEPSLARMAQMAIELLSAPSRDWFAPKPKFFLMIEGSQIDWASHNNETDNCVRQMLLFDMAVKEAVEFAQRDRNTLLIITADHETGGLVLVTNDENRIVADWNSKGHTGRDVPIFAFGPGSGTFAGALDNTDIPKHIARLTGIQPFPSPKISAEQKAAAGGVR